ncbi:uncharacterized protein E5676_scaffold1213G00090 [Cucumis melo var. makuwa]|uniref:Reverse transcriptase n=1 Tax=Cucumis melo var. makuwa TaxID=1194695 RepID=A0A5D3DUY1_CUCMM|nr:uncharacterized protein E6C27_scaffold381G00130 [Cucumis melo var. makuwa]TYK27511.1 uncharacterized protein E5676_scaffold1213G00090 [Cucumis melo var. makuwa]
MRVNSVANTSLLTLPCASASSSTRHHLKEINPSFCTHRIHLEEGAKNEVQPQKHLNPTLKEVVKKEVFKLKGIGIIDPIPHSTWLSPNHVVSKKIGMTIGENSQGKCIEVFMDDFIVYGKDFDSCLNNLEVFIDANLVLNFEMCHFMASYGIVLDKLNSSPILQTPNWNLPFEIMRDASDYALDRKGMDNPVVDHLSRIVKKQDENLLREHFFDEYVFKLDLHTP